MRHRTDAAARATGHAGSRAQRASARPDQKTLPNPAQTQTQALRRAAPSTTVEVAAGDNGARRLAGGAVERLEKCLGRLSGAGLNRWEWERGELTLSDPSLAGGRGTGELNRALPLVFAGRES
jgi:hypothetical protein